MTLPSTKTQCDGLITVHTEDGPEVSACLGPCCTGRRVVRARIATTGDPFLGAATADPEAF